MIPSTSNIYKQNLKGWMIVACGGIFYMYQFMIRVSPNIMNGELLTNFAIDSAGLGILLGAYNWSYSAMQIPLGITIDRFGPKFFLCISAGICAISCFIFGNTMNPVIGGSARFLMGLGSACGLIGTIKLGTLWLEPKHIAKVTSLAILMGTAGASLGGVPLGILLNKLGFEDTMKFLGFIGLLVCLIIYFFVNNYPPMKPNDKTLAKLSNSGPLADIWVLIKTPQAWILAVYGMFMYLPITVIGVVWGVSFIKVTTGTSDIMAASVVSTMFLGAAIGGPIFAYFSDFIKSRRLPMLCGSTVSALVWFIVIVFEVPFYLLYILFFLGGFAYTAKCLSFASICEIMPLKMSGVSIAFVNAIVMSTGTIFLPIIGALISYHNNLPSSKDTACYVVEDYRFALIIIPVFLLLSFIIILFMKETHPDHISQKYEQ